ncbi:hypothetical protein [Paenibacillus qinlingensis]|uniref:Cyanate lyase n=1 Tax=Paenibacillus qinlingensis TaxID=1837343 RepID=A0ABU1P1V2_9BACL|nr:hypothetical protein [Paenibacillus qinlingensis]MDR6553311.1 cyanate lyase [Paenibacillus qinlingensis]
MSVNSPKSSKKIQELDIVEVAKALGIDQARLLAYVYNRQEASHDHIRVVPVSSSEPS